MSDEPPRAELRTSSLAAATAWLTQTPATSIWRGEVGTEDWLRVDGPSGVEELPLPRGTSHRLGRAKAGMVEPPTVAHEGFVSSQAARLTHDGARWWLARRDECHERVPTMLGTRALGRGESAPVVHGDVLLIGKLRLSLVDRRFVAPLLPAGMVDPRTGLLSRLGFEQELAGLAAIGRRGVVVALAFDRGGDGKQAARAALELHASSPRLPVMAEGEIAAALSLDHAPLDELIGRARELARAFGARVVGTWSLTGDVGRVGHELELLMSAAGAHEGGEVVSLRDSPVMSRIASSVELLAEPADPRRPLVLFALGELGALESLGPAVVPTLVDELLAVAASLARGKTKVACVGGAIVAARVHAPDAESYAAEVQREWHARPPLLDGKMELPRTLVAELAQGELASAASELAAAMRGHPSVLASRAAGLPFPIAGRVALAATATSAVERIKLLFDVLEGAWRMIAWVLTAARLADGVACDGLAAFAAANATRHAYPLGTWRALARLCAHELEGADGPLSELATSVSRVDAARGPGLDGVAERLHSLRNRFAHEVYPEARAAEDVGELERTTADFLRALRPLAAWTLVSIERTEPDPFGEGQRIVYVDHTGPVAAGERRVVGLRSQARLGNIVYLARFREGLLVPLEPFVRRLPGGHALDLYWAARLPRPGREPYEPVLRGEPRSSDLDARRLPPVLRGLFDGALHARGPEPDGAAMKLYGSTTSPFVRKVSVLAREVGLWDRIEEVSLKTSPLAPAEPLAAAHPLAKLPTLITDDGEAVYDSRVICEHLDGLHAGRPMFPREPRARLLALRQQALADGILDASVLVFYETVYRDEATRDPRWQAGQVTKACAGLDALEREVETLRREPDIGCVAIACALGWLEFRAPLGELRAARPGLFAWYDAFAERPSMQATRPRA